MIDSTHFMDALIERGYGLVAGVPCSYLTPLINASIDDPRVEYVNAANEGEAVAIAAGCSLGGRWGVAMFQNSGLGNAVSPLTSLTWTFRLPVLIIVTWRGQPDGPSDEPQHELMGQIMLRQLDLMEIPHAIFPTDRDGIATALQTAECHFKQTGRPFALVMQKGSVAPRELETKPSRVTHSSVDSNHLSDASVCFESDDVLRTLVDCTDQNDSIIATTGFTGRALYAVQDRDNHLYMVGSMGCASSLGLGLQLSQPRRRVIVVDGDGSVLMRMGAMAAVASSKAESMVHLVLDNGVHDSTGAQATLSPSADLPAIAKGCGYRRVDVVQDLNHLRTLLANDPPSADNDRGDDASTTFNDGARGPRMIYVRTSPRSDRKLPRPTITPSDVAKRMQRTFD